MSALRPPVKTVLVVDDDEVFRDMVREVLELADYRVLVAQNALEALQISRLLFMSGDAAAIAPGNSRRHQDAAFIQKPFTPDQLLSKVREILGG